MCKSGCCFDCCEKVVDKKPAKQSLNIKAKTIYFIGTLIVIFTISYGRVDFFLMGLVSFVVQFFVDTYAVTYLYKPTLIVSDPTSVISKLTLTMAS